MTKLKPTFPGSKTKSAGVRRVSLVDEKAEELWKKDESD